MGCGQSRNPFWLDNCTIDNYSFDGSSEANGSLRKINGKYYLRKGDKWLEVIVQVVTNQEDDTQKDWQELHTFGKKKDLKDVYQELESLGYQVVSGDYVKENILKVTNIQYPARIFKLEIKRDLDSYYCVLYYY